MSRVDFERAFRDFDEGVERAKREGADDDGEHFALGVAIAALAMAEAEGNTAAAEGLKRVAKMTADCGTHTFQEEVDMAREAARAYVVPDSPGDGPRLTKLTRDRFTIVKEERDQHERLQKINANIMDAIDSKEEN